jgi:hypothetical protein
MSQRHNGRLPTGRHSKTLRSSNDAQHEAHKDLARLIMIRTFGPMELLILELLIQADSPKKFD